MNCPKESDRDFYSIFAEFCFGEFQVWSTKILRLCRFSWLRGGAFNGSCRSKDLVFVYFCHGDLLAQLYPNFTEGAIPFFTLNWSKYVELSNIWSFFFVYYMDDPIYKIMIGNF
ncbi:hypothetical protein EUGRSUZ_F04486 [Eucalyptus grandis]|uniref:Uncharacterized protein n=2 Tax=Eucalyptus grandis TaxID=71139 RepID=A0ACC3KQM1_EUCGR|nr:hypothetical protein EUGRSUZ_F04486 [Eucalyptus grandis]